MKHLVAECPSVISLWGNLGKWIFNKIGLNFYIDGTMKILGYLKIEIKRRFIKQEPLYSTKSKSFIFYKNWTMWGNLFDDTEI